MGRNPSSWLGRRPTVAEEVLCCDKCKRRFRTKTYEPGRRYTCPECHGALRPESKPGSDTPADALKSDGTDHGAPSDPLVGQQVGPYKILSKLGEGGMGAVYKAQHVTLRRFSALKILPQRMVEKSPKAVQRFMREARSAAVLSHPNIVTVYTIGDADGHQFIDMEFVKGESLDSRLKREGRLSVAEATRIVRDTAKALGAAHARKIVHRDIKPGNIMVDAVPAFAC